MWVECKNSKLWRHPEKMNISKVGLSSLIKGEANWQSEALTFFLHLYEKNEGYKELSMIGSPTNGIFFSTLFLFKNLRYEIL